MNTGTAYLELGSSWENEYCESFNGKMRNKFLRGETLNVFVKAEIFIRWWANTYDACNSVWFLSLLGYRSFVPQFILKPA